MDRQDREARLWHEVADLLGVEEHSVVRDLMQLSSNTLLIIRDGLKKRGVA